MKKERASNYEQNGTSVLPFPPLPVQVNTSPPPRQTNRIPLVIGLMVGVGLTAFLIVAIPWDLVSQTLTDSVDSLSDQVKQIQLAQVKQPKKTISPPEVTAPAALTDETAPAPEVSTDATSMGETAPAPEVSAPKTSAVSTPATPPIEVVPIIPIPEPDPRLLVGRYPVREYAYIRDSISRDDTLYNFVREYGNQIFPKKYRDWKQLAQYNGIHPPEYTLKLGAEFRIPTLTHTVLPKIGYETDLKEIQSELTKQSNNPELLNQRALIHFKRNELNQARSTLQRGIRAAPKNGVLHNNLGFIYLIIEDDRRAQSEFELAITHSDKPAIPHCNLGTLYMTTDKFDLAIKAFESALEADANLLDAKYNLALAHEKVGNVDSAREHLRELNQLLSEDAAVASALERLISPSVRAE